MKKTLAILGLLVCTSGIVYAENATVVESTAQQTDVPQVEKQYTDNVRFKDSNDIKAIRKTEKQNFVKKADRKELKANKDIQKHKFSRIGKDEYRGQKSDIRNDKYNPKFKDFRANRPNHYMSRNQKHNQRFNSHNHRHHNMRHYRVHNRIYNKRAYRQPAKIR